MKLSSLLLLGKEYNQNLGLLKDWHAKGNFVAPGSFRVHSVVFIVVFLLVASAAVVVHPFVAVLKPQKGSFFYDMKSHLNGTNSPSPTIHISKVSFGMKRGFWEIISILQRDLAFLSQLSELNTGIRSFGHFSLLSACSTFLSVDFRGAEELSFGWDDNWRVGALIRISHDQGVIAKVYQHGLVGNIGRYVPYGDFFFFFEENFEDTVPNPLDVVLLQYQMAPKLKNIFWKEDGNRVLFLTRLSEEELEFVDFESYDLVIFHPLQKLSSKFALKGSYLSDCDKLYIKSADVMKSTIYYELRAIGIPASLIE